MNKPMIINQEVKFCKLAGQKFYYLVYATSGWDPNRREVLVYGQDHKWFASGAITSDLAKQRASIKIITPEGKRDLVKFLFTSRAWFK